VDGFPGTRADFASQAARSLVEMHLPFFQCYQVPEYTLVGYVEDSVGRFPTMIRSRKTSSTLIVNGLATTLASVRCLYEHGAGVPTRPGDRIRPLGEAGQLLAGGHAVVPSAADIASWRSLNHSLPPAQPDDGRLSASDQAGELIDVDEMFDGMASPSSSEQYATDSYSADLHDISDDADLDAMLETLGKDDMAEFAAMEVA
ncbi:hypothetical protein LTR53_009385, partial [Teratosphaeriaceae sp. CCFEE 6253]